MGWTAKWFPVVNRFFQGVEGAAAQQTLVVASEDMRELLSRSLLADFEKGGRYSDRDLEGMRALIPTLGKAESFSMQQVLNLRNRLRSSIEHSLAVGTGTADIPDSTFHSASAQGFDLSGIRPKNNFYSPYMPRPYAASGQMQPGHSPKDLLGIRDEYLLDQAFSQGKYNIPVFDTAGTGVTGYSRVGEEYLIKYPEIREILLEHLRRRRAERWEDTP